MGHKKINRFHWVNNGVMTGTAVVTGAPQEIQNFDNLGIQIDYVGTAVGTIVISASIDGITYYPLTFSPTISNPSGGSGGQLVSINQMPYNFIKFAYTNSSGSGVLNVHLFEKDLN